MSVARLSAPSGAGFADAASVVGVAERLRRQVVALEIEGSNPSVHPIPSFNFALDIKLEPRL